MGLWRILLIVVLSWFLMGAIAAVILQHSRRGLRDKVISDSRDSVARAVETYRHRHPEYSVPAANFALNLSAEALLVGAYFVFFTAGPIAFFFLWAASSVERRGS